MYILISRVLVSMLSPGIEIDAKSSFVLQLNSITKATPTSWCLHPNYFQMNKPRQPSRLRPNLKTLNYVLKIFSRELFFNYVPIVTMFLKNVSPDEWFRQKATCTTVRCHRGRQNLPRQGRFTEAHAFPTVFNIRLKTGLSCVS